MTEVEYDDEPTQLLDPLVVRSRQRVGQVLREKWRLDVLLGVGGMAAVYAATHRNGSRVAIKILHPDLSISVDVRARFLREGYAANSVGHDGVVRVSDDDVAEDAAPFIVMELLDGETLEERRKRHGGRLSEDEVLSAADQVLDVLAAAHARGIVHRDLKPENIFLTRDGRVKVLDFGIAHVKKASTGSRATRGGQSMGTPAFMAPEQARGLWDQVDGRSDLWSLGATMFALLSGTEVHSGQTAYEVLFEAGTKPAPPLASVLPEASPAVARVVDTALAFEREHRWQDAAAMQEAARSAYYDRFGSPISTAPRLTIPETVTNRTLPSATVAPVSPGLPTTNGAVAATRLGVSVPGAFASLAFFRSASPIALGVGGAVVVAAIGVGVALMFSGTKPPSSSSGATMAPARPQPSAPSAVSSSQASPPAPPAASKPNAVPVVAATDLPLAPPEAVETTKPAPRPPVPVTAPATVTATSAKTAEPNRSNDDESQRVGRSTVTTAETAEPNCSPPFLIDSAGIKRWKPQCF